jgi:large subunit ribosomal protein L17
MVKALIDQERIVTTIEKAKEVQRLAERVINLSKRKTLTNIRRAASLIGSRMLENLVVTQETVGEGKDKQTKQKVKARTTLQKLFDEIGPRYVGEKERKGGYTRIVKLARRRLGDNASQCLFELVESRSADGTPYTKTE